MDGINLSLLPPLTVVEQVDYEAIVAAIAERASLENASPSDPAYRVALAGAYREMLLRQDANEQARGLMLAYALGAELDHIGTTYYRNADGSPVVRLNGEGDDDYRERLQLAPEGLSVAGPEGAYEFHAQSAHPMVKGVSVDSPAPVEVNLYVLSHEGNGVPSTEILAAVRLYLEPRRPLTDLVKVFPAEVMTYRVTATLTLKPGPAPELVRQAAENAALAHVELKQQLKSRVVESGLHAAMTVEGVEEVHLANWADVICSAHQAPFCESLTVTIGGYV